MDSVGQRIAKLRKDNGWSQLELAQKLNVSDKTVSKWENGGMPGIDLFPQIAKLFNVSIDYLITGNEESSPLKENKVEDNCENTAQEDLPIRRSKKYTCPMCKKVNINPGEHCVYCYHEFDRSMIDALEETVEEVKAKQPAVLSDESSQKPICPKCGKENPCASDHCLYCYHELKSTGPASDKRRAASVENQYYLSVLSGEVSAVKAKPNQLGWVAFLVAFLFPLVGLIWGLVKHDKRVVIFSIVMMLIDIIVVYSFLIDFLLDLLSLATLPSGTEFYWATQ